MKILSNDSKRKKLIPAADTSARQYELYYVSKQHNITDNARVTLCHSGVFVFLWGCSPNIVYPHCRSPPASVQIS